MRCACTNIRIMKQWQPRIVGVNILGVAGYLLALLGWVLLATVIVALLVTPPAGVPVVPSELIQGQSLPVWTTGVGYVVAVIVSLAAVALVVILPYLIGKSGSRMLRWILELLHVVPTKRTLFLAKTIATVVPLIGFFIIPFFITPTMTFSLVYIAAVASAVLALVFFLLQLIIARALHVPERLVW
jgi:hypothetical protein